MNKNPWLVPLVVIILLVLGAAAVYGLTKTTYNYVQPYSGNYQFVPGVGGGPDTNQITPSIIPTDTPKPTDTITPTFDFNLQSS